jgi:hypothetical protein
MQYCPQRQFLMACSGHDMYNKTFSKERGNFQPIMFFGSLRTAQTFLLATYEGSIGLVTGKMKKIIAYVHVLVLFMAKKHDLGDNFFSVTRRCRSHQFSPRQQPLP